MGCEEMCEFASLSFGGWKWFVYIFFLLVRGIFQTSLRKHDVDTRERCVGRAKCSLIRHASTKLSRGAEMKKHKISAFPRVLSMLLRFYYYAMILLEWSDENGEGNKKSLNGLEMNKKLCFVNAFNTRASERGWFIHLFALPRPSPHSARLQLKMSHPRATLTRSQFQP